MSQTLQRGPALARLIASGLYSGYAPKAPGTAGSVLAAILGAALLEWSPWALLAAAVVACVAGVWAIHAVQGEDDPGWIVIDEFAGQWLTMLGLTVLTPQGVVAAFLLFRLLDIAKPGPIGWLDRRHGPVAVMGDDVVAGLIGAFILLGIRLIWPGALD